MLTLFACTQSHSHTLECPSSRHPHKKQANIPSGCKMAVKAWNERLAGAGDEQTLWSRAISTSTDIDLRSVGLSTACCVSYGFNFISDKFFVVSFNCFCILHYITKAATKSTVPNTAISQIVLVFNSSCPATSDGRRMCRIIFIFYCFYAQQRQKDINCLHLETLHIFILIEFV